jgi:hypothetical protein
MMPMAIVIKHFGVIYATIGTISVKILRKYAIGVKNCGKIFNDTCDHCYKTSLW